MAFLMHLKKIFGSTSSACNGQKDMGRKGPHRGFEELKIFANPPQAGSERFPNHVESPPPRIAYFRNNLVALSQYYNLFFVASVDQILVYQPENQDQYLPLPQSTINLATSDRGVPGYIDPSNSHAVNQLIVADLGIEELLVAVCDDGDVVAYTTRSIRKEIEDRAPDDYRSSDFVSELRPFFINNVGMSAWGVAVHQEARMIAVSSNSRKINVFVFALSDSNCGTSDAGEEEDILMSSLSAHEWIQTASPRTLDPKDRSRNIEIVLAGHWNNVPNIAFFNPAIPSDDAVFLVSTDIDGATFIWDVWQRAIAKEFHLALESNRGWGVSCIDPYFCRSAKSLQELLGSEKVGSDAVAVDTTFTVKDVPESSENHFTLRNQTINPPEPEDQHDWEIDGAEVDDEYDEDFEADDDLGLDEHTEFADDTAQQDEEDDSFSLHAHTGYLENVMTEEGEGAETSTPASVSNAAHVDILQQAYIEGATEEISTVLANTPEPFREMMRTQLARAVRSVSKFLPAKKEWPVLPFSILQTTRTDIRLLHSISPPTNGLLSKGSVKEVICRSPLHQHLRPEESWLGRLERLNMVLQIPELGLVAVGDQTGRVALLTLTRVRGECKEMKHHEAGFRLERFLPLMSQEDDNQRPKTELLGIAVGPISSRLLRRADGLDDEHDRYGYNRRHEGWREYEGSRRYRLVLYYRDHTVLSYEIKRPFKGELDVLDI
ncbi:MAG: hypothetical protein L6R41_004486 [Letrouitia leprolyta]|nr:MAG: hypothetical protein L6R41_004486 [Letrouitia leprolyta]